jgi:hypothetical protein
LALRPPANTTVISQAKDAAMVIGFQKYGTRLQTGLGQLERSRCHSRTDITVEDPYSVMTHRLLSDIARDGGGDVKNAASGDPPVKTQESAFSAAAGRAKARKRRR